MSAPQKPLVFISHKVLDPVTEPILEQILRTLSEHTEIKIDVISIPPGREWQDEIEKWLFECQAAILLLSPEAVRSFWVQFETNFLCLRRRLIDSNLTILPVPLGNVRMNELPPEFEISRISGIEAVCSPDADGLVQVLVNQLRMVQELYGPQPPLYELERDLVQLFNEVGQNLQTEIVLDAVTRMGLGRTALDTIRDKWRWLARKLFTIDLDQLDEVMRVFPASVRERSGRKIVNTVAPFCWVDENAAACIPKVASKPESQRCLGINSMKVRTAEMYIRRACTRSKMWPYKPVPSDWSMERPGEDLAYSVRKIVMEMIGYDSADEVTPEDFRAALCEEIQENGPVIVILPESVYRADASFLAELMDLEEFRPLTFMVLLGNITLQNFENGHRTRIEYVRPEIDCRKESEAHRRINQMIRA